MNYYIIFPKIGRTEAEIDETKYRLGRAAEALDGKEEGWYSYFTNPILSDESNEGIIKYLLKELPRLEIADKFVTITNPWDYECDPTYRMICDLIHGIVEMRSRDENEPREHYIHEFRCPLNGMTLDSRDLCCIKPTVDGKSHDEEDMS